MVQANPGALQKGKGNYYKDVIAAKKEITAAIKELKVSKTENAV